MLCLHLITRPCLVNNIHFMNYSNLHSRALVSIVEYSVYVTLLFRLSRCSVFGGDEFTRRRKKIILFTPSTKTKHSCHSCFLFTKSMCRCEVSGFGWRHEFMGNWELGQSFLSNHTRKTLFLFDCEKCWEWTRRWMDFSTGMQQLSIKHISTRKKR